jgi:signal transduction histidine kinase
MPWAKFLLLALFAGCLLAAERPSVLVLLSYHRGQPWEDSVASGIQRVLGAQVELVFLHFDHKRFPTPEDGDSRLVVALETAARARPVVIVAVDDHAWTLAIRHRGELGAQVPIVFCGLNHWDAGARPPNTTGVVEAYDLRGTLELAFRLHPACRRLVVLNDATETGQANRATLAMAMPAAAAGRQVVDIGLGSFAETEAALRGLDPERDVVLQLNWNLDASGATQAHEDAVRRARGACRAPIYGVWDFQFGHGIVGGSLMDGQMHGQEAGELVQRLLAGVRADDLPVREHPRTRTVVAAGELARFGLLPGDVPAGVEVSGLEPEFWERHGQIVLIATLVIAAQAGTIAGLLVAMRRRRLAERAQREVEVRLRRSQRMDAVGQLAAGIAHDFNNVLTAILGHADLLALRLGDRRDLQGSVGVISSAAQRAAGTVRNLLAFARGSAGASGSCAVNEVLREVVALLEHSIDRRIAVSTTLDAQARRAGIDGAELQQVVVNLALNARDAMPNGGRLEIATRLVSLTDAVELKALGLVSGGYVVIEVADTGGGMPPEQLERIFDPFFTTKDVGKGTGLGLAVVHGAVVRAKGAIRVESVVGQGTRFRIWLPATIDRPTERPVQRSAVGGLRVLLVDDEEQVGLVVQRLLETCGCRVELFRDPGVVGAWFADHQDEVDVAMLDGNMPGLTGWQLAARLQEMRPELPVIALTGAATPEAMSAWRANGVTCILTKPIGREQLQRALAEFARSPA